MEVICLVGVARHFCNVPDKRRSQQHLAHLGASRSQVLWGLLSLPGGPSKRAGRLSRSAFISSLTALAFSGAFPNMALSHFVTPGQSLRQVYSPGQGHRPDTRTGEAEGYWQVAPSPCSKAGAIVTSILRWCVPLAATAGLLAMLVWPRCMPLGVSNSRERVLEAHAFR